MYSGEMRVRQTDAMQRSGWWSDALYRPRRVWLRKAMFQVHLWSGLIVGLLATVAGVTGSAVVYREELDRVLAPGLYKVSRGPALSADTLLERVRAQMPEASIQTFDTEVGPKPWVYRFTRADGRRSAAYVDPASGTLLGVRGEREGVMNWLDDLHTELLGGQVGMWVNGVGAAGLLLLCLTGVVVWWPGHGHVGRALRIQMPGRWRRLNWDVHTAGGFWVALPLAVESFSGVYLCFGFGLALVLFGGRAAEFEELVGSPKLVQACAAPRQPLEDMLQRARVLHPGAADVFAELPTDGASGFTVLLRSARDLRDGQVAVVAFDPCSGAVLKNADSRDASLPLRIALYLDAFHFGLIGGEMTRVAWVLLGLAPGVLFVTGFLLWWRRTGRRRFGLAG